MSGLFGGASKATTHATRAMGIDFQGAQYGPVVPVVYGQNKVPGNCVWYGDFQSHAQQQKQGKGGGGGGTTNYTYSASAQMGLCEGPGVSLVRVYDGTSVVDLSSLNYAFAAGNLGQSAWSHLSGTAALGYSLTAVFSFQNLDLGSQASLPNYNYEVKALKPFSASIPDANPADIVSDVCSDPYHGINFPYLGNLTQYSNYCVANSLFLSPVYDQQQSGQQTLSDLFKYTNAYAYYSDDQLKVVPLGDVAVTGNGVTFTPNVTPLVDLDDTDFLVNGDGDPPVTFDRVAPQDALNLVRVEYKNRANTYHDDGVVGAIDYDVVANGERSDTSETVNGCTTAAVARFIAQNLVQRTFYIRNTYQFKLPWNYCYLEPTDIVTLTDASLKLVKEPVRITSVKEDGGSVLTIESEEFPEGIGHSSIYGTQPNGGTNIDQNGDPGPVNPPYLFRGPGMLVSNNTPEIWCACNGSGDLWGACEVHLSHDGSSYTYVGTIASQARYGTLTSSLPVGSADPDITHQPTVQLYAPAQLLGGSQTDADNFVTLAMVDTEVFAYETAALQSANTYKLSYLRRGGYGSANVAHSSGAPFARLDDSIFRLPVDPSLIGSTVYLKFLSLNVFGRTPRTLAEETAYTYVVGTNVELPDVPDVPASFAVLPIADGVNITWTNNNPAAVGCTSIEYATASGGPWSVLAQVGPTTTAYTHHFTTGAMYYYRARARGPLLQSGWSAYTAVLSSTGANVSGPGGTTDIANTATALASQVAVLNPGFDAGDTGWSKGTGWSIKSDGSFGHGQGYAERVGGSDGAIRNNAVCFVQPGHSYKVQALIKAIGANGECHARISWRDLNDNEIDTTPGDAITGTTVAGSFAVGTPPDGAVFAHAEIAAVGHTTGKYQVDNVVSTLQPATADEIAETAGKKWAGQTGADVTSANTTFGDNVVINPSGKTGSIAPHATSNATLQSYVHDGSLRPSETPGGSFLLTGTVGVGTITRFNSGPIVDAQPGDIWMGSIWLGDWGAGNVGSGWLRVYFQNAAGSDLSSATVSFASLSDSDLQRYSVASPPAPAGTARVQLRLGLNMDSTNQQALFQRAELRKATVADAGSGVPVGDQRNLPALTYAGVSSMPTSQPLSYSISGTTITFVTSAFTMNRGSGGPVSYSASSASRSDQSAGTTRTYYAFFVDHGAQGGSKPLQVTAFLSTLAASDDNVFVGMCTVTIASGGGGSSGTGGGGGGVLQPPPGGYPTP